MARGGAGEALSPPVESVPQESDRGPGMVRSSALSEGWEACGREPGGDQTVPQAPPASGKNQCVVISTSYQLGPRLRTWGLSIKKLH